MAITETAIPVATNINFSKNSIPVDFSVDDLYDTNGLSFGEEIKILAPATLGQTLIFIYGSQNVVLTAGSPDYSGTIFDIGATDEEQRDYIVEALKKNYIIYNDFEIFANTYAGKFAVFLYAKRSGTDYVISHSGSTISYSPVVTDAAADAIKKTNYKVLLDVYMYTGLPPTTLTPDVQIVRMQQAPDNNTLKVYFDLKDILDAHVRRGIDLPDYNQENITELTYALRKYYLRYTEYYGTPATAKIVTQTDDLWVLRGGVDVKMNKLFDDETFIHYWCTAPASGPRKFLTWAPNAKLIGLNQIEFLYMVVSNEVGNTVKLLVDLYYKNGSSAPGVYTGKSRTLATDYHKLLCVPVSAYILNFNDEDLAYYDVYLTVSDVQYTEKRRYVIDGRCYYSEHYFLFQNSIGGMDTLCTTGDVIEGVRVTRENFEAENNRYDYDYAAGQLKNYNIESRRRLKVSTGFCSREYIRYLVNELLMSEAVYEMTLGEADGGEDTWLNPVVVDTNSIEYLTNLRDQFAVTFEVSYSWADKVYTPHEDLT